MESNNNTIGDRIFYLREKKKVSMDTLAKAIGTKSSTISDWENDKNLPGAKYLIGLSDYFDVTIDWILKGEGFAVPKKPFPISLSQTAFMVEECFKQGYNVSIEIFNFSGDFHFELYADVFGARDRAQDIIMFLSEEQRNWSIMDTYNKKGVIKLPRSERDLIARQSMLDTDLFSIDTKTMDTSSSYMLNLHCPPNWFKEKYELARKNIKDDQIAQKLDKIEDEAEKKYLDEQGFEL